VACLKCAVQSSDPHQGEPSQMHNAPFTRRRDFITLAGGPARAAPPSTANNLLDLSV
jgi:hypothetical protein